MSPAGYMAAALACVLAGFLLREYIVDHQPSIFDWPVK